MRMQGKRIHCEVDARAGQKNATSGKAGFSRLVSESMIMVPLEPLVVASAFRFLRGLWDDLGDCILKRDQCYRGIALSGPGRLETSITEIL